MIWLVLASMGGVSAQFLLRWLNAMQKPGYSHKEFLRLNWIQFTTAGVGSVIASIAIPGMTWITALWTGFTGGNIAKDGMKGIERKKLQDGN